MKIKTLIAALSVFVAAAFMTACSDDNDNVRAANPTEPAATAATTPSAEDGKDAVAEKARQVAKQMQMVSRLNALAGVNYDEDNFCSADEYTQFSGDYKLKAQLNLLTKSDVSLESHKRTALSLGSLLDASTNDYCTMNIISVVAKAAIKRYLKDGTGDFSFVTAEYQALENQKLEEIYNTIHPASVNAMSKIRAIEAKQEQDALKKEIGRYMNDIRNNINAIKTNADTFFDIEPCPINTTCSQLYKDASYVADVVRSFAKETEKSYENYDIQGPNDANLVAKRDVLKTIWIDSQTHKRISESMIKKLAASKAK